MGNVHLEHPRGLQMPLLYPQDILNSRVRGEVNWRGAAITGGATQISGEPRLMPRCRFGRFELRPDERVLLVDGQPAALGARAFDLLQALVEHRDRLLTKDELLRTVWTGLVVSENNLHTQVSALRAVLGAPAIATVAGRGYRFALQLHGERGADPADIGPVAVAGHQAPPGTAEGLKWSLCFGRIEVRPRERQLLVDGQAVSVGSRAYDLLLQLIRLHPRLVTKNELLDLVWPGVIVAENNLQAQMSALRKLLGPEAIATVPGRGYTFTLPQSEAETSHPEAQRLDQEGSTCLRPGNLAVRMPPLYGRGDDLAALTRLLQSQQVLSVVGPGGIGKTRVAQAAAHALHASYPDGVWLVELAPLTDPLLVAPTAARLLGLAIAPNEGALSSLVEVVRHRRLLLVLDNCEHLLPAVAELAMKVAAGAPGVRLLVTSQEPLHIAEEWVHRLGALAVPMTADAESALNYGAVELFSARAQAADPRFTLSADNTEAVVEICRRLDGIALAIELAAARVRVLGVHGLRQRLSEQLNLLAGGVRTALPRHQTLRAALQWSYALLSSEERTVFDRLGVFVGSFSLEAAQQLACDETDDAWTVLDHLATLVDKSLVLVEGSDVPRYRLLESSRAFALERLAAAGVMEPLRRRHAQVIAETLMGDDPMEGPNARMHRVVPDLDNVRAAAAWATGPDGDRQIAIALAAATDMLWDEKGCNDEGERLYTLVEPWVNESTPPRLAARYWLAVSNLRLLVRVKHQAHAGLKAADLFRSQGDRFWVFRSLQSAVAKFSWLGDAAATEKALAEMQTLLDPSWPSWTRTAIELSLANYDYFVANRLLEARKHFDAAVEFHRHSGGDRYFPELCEMLLLPLDIALDSFDTALERADDLLKRQDTRARAMTFAWRGAALTGLGRLQEAELSFRTSLTQFRHAAGSAYWAPFVAHLLARQGRTRDAARLVGYIDRFRATETLVRAPAARRVAEATHAIIAPTLGATELDRLRTEGRSLTEDEAIALAFPSGTSST